MKVNLKKIGIEAEGDIEGLTKKILDNRENEWKDKLEAKHKAKKEIMELKHKYKMDEQNIKNSIFNKVNYEFENKKKMVSDSKKDNRSRNIVCIVSIILFFVYGLFCIVGFKNFHIGLGIVSLIQMVLTILSIFTSFKIINLFKNDYKLFLIVSVLLILLWFIFMVQDIILYEQGF